jgi:uncharacterized DUF497 family protein
MEFRWLAWNIQKCEKHGVRHEDAEYVVRHARRPYPRQIEDEKTLVHGQAEAGQYLQVVYLIDDDECIFVIHAMPMTERMKRNYRGSRR